MIKTPTRRPVRVMSAKPFSNPAETAPIPMKVSQPVRGIKAARVVKNAVKIILNAFLILCFRDSIFALDSSKIINWLSIPVPIAAMIPAMAGRSRVKTCLNSAANPRIIKTSERDVKISANDIFIFLYLMKTKIETARIANTAAFKICFVKSSPRLGEILSSFSIVSLNGREPVFKIVCNFFISIFALS